MNLKTAVTQKPGSGREGPQSGDDLAENMTQQDGPGIGGLELLCSGLDVLQGRAMLAISDCSSGPLVMTSFRAVGLAALQYQFHQFYTSPPAPWSGSG